MKDKILYRKRKWINPDKTSNAFVNAVVERYSSLRYEGTPHIGGDVCIADCNRVISLDLWASNKRTKNNTIKKLDNLIEVLQEVRDVIESEEV